MKFKTFIKLFIPPIILSIKKYITTSKSIKADFYSTINQLEKKSDSLLIFGNGPSLSKSLELYSDKINRYDCIVVNHFCETEYYEKVKPIYYLLADPVFFFNIDSYSEEIKNRTKKCINALIENTKWDISLIIPSYANNSEFVNYMKKNSYIHLYYYNHTDLIENYEKNKFKLWDKNLISIPAQTCLNSCLWLGIFLRYKECYLIGADSNWIEQLCVDQRTNEIYTLDQHFYGETKRILYEDTEGKIPAKLYKELDSNSNAFKLYWELKEYADYAGVKVYNASEYSLIDAFERKKL